MHHHQTDDGEDNHRAEEDQGGGEASVAFPARRLRQEREGFGSRRASHVLLTEPADAALGG